MHMEISEVEKEALIEFREKLSGQIKKSHDKEHFLIRFLRARNLDQEKAKNMLINYLHWLDINKNQSVIPNWVPLKLVSDNFVFKFIGEDLGGRPVIWAPMGKWDAPKLIDNGLTEEAFRYVYYLMDQILEKFGEAQKKMNSTSAGQVVALLDMAELSFGKLSYGMLQCALRFFRELEAYYPELLHSVYVFNAPYVFNIIFNTVKPIMSSRTTSKINFMDHNDKKWKPILIKAFPEDVIPLEYGGTGQSIL